MSTMKVFNISIFTLWLILITILLYREEKAEILKANEVMESIIKSEDYWYVLYRDGKKVGYKRITKDKIGNEIILKSFTKIIDEEHPERELKVFTDTSSKLRGFEFTVKTEKEYRNIKGEVDGNDLILLIESGEKREAKKLTIDKDIFFELTYIPSIINEKPVNGQVFTIQVFDMIDVKIKSITVKVMEIRPLKVGINVISIYRLISEGKEIWVNENGIILKEEIPSEGTYYYHTKAFAEKESESLFIDYTKLIFFKSNKIIPEETSFLKIRIKGIRIDPELYKGSNVFIKDNIMTISAIDMKDIEKERHLLPFKDKRMERYLSPTKWISSDYEPLKNTGLIYAKSNNYDALELVKYLNSYLFNLIITSPKFFIHSSRDILSYLSGDSIERTLMFATYSRAAGLPVRITGGIVYLNGYFYPHVWNEVWLGKWVPVDSTFYEFPAKITHIPLFKDNLEDIINGIKNLGDLEIEIVEVS